MIGSVFRWTGGDVGCGGWSCCCCGMGLVCTGGVSVVLGGVSIILGAFRLYLGGVSVIHILYIEDIELSYILEVM